MSNPKGKPVPPKPTNPKPAAVPAVKPAEPKAAEKTDALPPGIKPVVPSLFRPIDWLAFGITTVLVLIGYLLTVAPDLTLEDSGELAVASYYAGVPHPPGYPVWTLYTWLFTVLFPVSNIAYRVAVSSALAGAFSCGLVALMVSRGSSMMIEGIALFRELNRRTENALCLVSGFVGGMLIGFNGFMWSQAVIVEVYTLSVLSLAGVLVCLMRWLYAPQQRRYLYLAFFWFGITFNNHQSLLVTILGIEVFVLAVQPRLGRELFFWNTIIFIAGLVLQPSVLKDNKPLFAIYILIGVASALLWVYLTVKTKKKGLELLRDIALVASLGYVAVLILAITSHITVFEFKTGLFVVFNLAGIGFIASFVYLILRTKQFGKEWSAVLICGATWIAGAAFYLYMPLASMTNPPLNWGYPRTVTGFFHAFTRGQYERIHPTTGTGDNPFEQTISFVSRLGQQVFSYIGGALEEFNLAFLLIGLVPFLFYRYMQKREKAWIIGLVAIYFTLSLFLLYLLNPAPDRQSRDLNRVFFTASHVIIAMATGYGLTLLGAALAQHYQRFRQWALYATAGTAAVALFVVAVVFQPGDEPLIQTLMFDLGPSHELFQRMTAVFSLVLALAAVAIIFLNRARAPMLAVLILFSALPVRSIMSHWYDNEQRGHLFGFWFGHDMFTPPFGIYPEMTKDAILFGGTDPGRFNPTYMIFCESFIPDSKKRDPKFDRRDVYLITQNALADGTYLSYIRAHYNRSTQIDPPFFSELLRGPKERETDYRTNILARAVIPIDNFFTKLGARIEKQRRADGVYPRTEINTPSNEDSQRAFQEYLTDAQRRLEHDKRFPNEPPQIRAGEDVRIIDNKVQVSGQVAVMAINGLLTKIIFDKNPTREFFVEESFPLDWMYPYLTPFGIIMKINREPVPEFTEDILGKDHQFWSKFSERLIGNWITYDTSVSNICQFANDTYNRRDHSAYKGVRSEFVRDSDAQKAFSKLRSSIAGVYAWRISDISRRIQEIQRKPVGEQQGLQGEVQRLSNEQQRVLREAEFAFKQAYAFCPYSPEAIFRFVNLLAGMQRIDEALMLTVNSWKLDPFNTQLEGLLRQLEAMKEQQNRMNAIPANNSVSVAQFQAEIAQLQQQFRASPTNAALASRGLQLLDQLMGSPQVNSGLLLFAARAYSDFGQPQRVETALQRLVQLEPANPEAWFDLSVMQTMLNKHPQALASLRNALQRSAERLKGNPAAPNLYSNAVQDARFAALRAGVEFQKLLTDFKPPGP